VALVMVLAAAATLPFFGGDFLPEFREGHSSSTWLRCQEPRWKNRGTRPEGHRRATKKFAHPLSLAAGWPGRKW